MTPGEYRSLNSFSEDPVEGAEIERIIDVAVGRQSAPSSRIVRAIPTIVREHSPEALALAGLNAPQSAEVHHLLPKVAPEVGAVAVGVKAA